MAELVVGGPDFPEYRHVREVRARPVEHTLGDQPEGIEDQPVYPPHVEPPPPEEAPPGKEAAKAKKPEEHHKTKVPEDASKHPTG
jgi:hypothetical protein